MKKIRHFKIYFQMKEKFGNVDKNDILRQCIQGCLRRLDRINLFITVGFPESVCIIL